METCGGADAEVRVNATGASGAAVLFRTYVVEVRADFCLGVGAVVAVGEVSSTSSGGW